MRRAPEISSFVRALRARSSDVRESLAAERECAVRNSEEIKARRKLANEEMRCAGIAADLDAARRRLEDLKRSASRTARPMTDAEFSRLATAMRTLPRGYRAVARDLVAETEGAHRVPVDGVGRWSEVLEDMKTFNGIAHRRLARFAKVRRRNRNALARGFCRIPNAGFDCGAGENFEFLDAAEGDGGDAGDAAAEKKIRGGKKAGDLNGDAPATVEVWDRRPVSRDGDIEVGVRDLSMPLATDAEYRDTDEKQGLLKWVVPLGAGEAKAITWTVRVNRSGDIEMTPIPE